MKLLRLNLLSLICALPFVLNAELYTNLLRLQASFPWISYARINIFLAALCLLLWYPFIRLYNRFLGRSNLKWAGTVLWIPYAIVLVCCCSLLFPIQNPQYSPGPGLAFELLPMLGIYMVYFLSVALFSWVIGLPSTPLGHLNGREARADQH